MKHLTNIEQLTVEEINQIYQRACEFEKGMRSANHPSGNVINMFFENSTRTRLSFEMAINKINAKIFDFKADISSINKGEDLFDTINNLSAIGLNLVIMRHSDDKLIEQLSSNIYYNDVSFVNAGSGISSHPTQALLDYCVLKKHFLNLENKIITFVGDIAHSRVAKSNIVLLKKFGMKIRCLCPSYFMGEKIPDVEYFEDLHSALYGCDVVMALRIQKERIQENIDYNDYIKRFQLTKDNLPYAVLLMHPGPVNWGIELSNDISQLQNSKTILRQAHTGVYTRMAILDILLSGQGL